MTASTPPVVTPENSTVSGWQPNPNCNWEISVAALGLTPDDFIRRTCFVPTTDFERSLWDSGLLPDDMRGRPLSVSTIELPNRRLTNEERQVWINDYWAHGGPTQFELEVVWAVNYFRARYGLEPVSLDFALMQAARFYSQQMVTFRTPERKIGHNMGPYATNPNPSVASGDASRRVAEAFGNTGVSG